MNFIDAYLERCKETSAEFIAKYPDSPGWITFAREQEGIIVSFFDKTTSEDTPIFVCAIRREDWRVLLDLMPKEWLSYPAQWYSDFERIEREAESKRET